MKLPFSMKKGGFLDMLLGTLGASLIGNLLTGKGERRASEGTIRPGEQVKVWLKQANIFNATSSFN